MSGNKTEDGIGYEANLDSTDNEEVDPIVPKSELEKIRILLRHREPQAGENADETLKQKQARQKRQAKSKGVKNPPPEIKGKNKYLHMVGAIDCIKQYDDWKTTLGLIQSWTQPKPQPKQRTKPVKAWSLAQKMDEAKQAENETSQKPKMTKLERKAHYEHCKQTF